MGTGKLPRGLAIFRGKIRFQFQHKGKPYREQTDINPTPNGILQAKREYKNWVDSIRYPVEDVDKQNNDIILFREVRKAYLKELESRGSESTFKSTKQKLENFYSPLDDLPIQSITTQRLLNMLTEADFNSGQTYNNHISPIRQLLKYAQSINLITVNPAASLVRKKYQSLGPDPYTAQEKAKLLEYFDQTSLKVYFRIAFGTGMRTGELLGMKWDKFNGTSFWIDHTVVASVEKDDTKNHKDRRVYLSDDLVHLLKTLPRPITGGYILTQEGSPMTTAIHANRCRKEAYEATGVRPRLASNGDLRLYPWRHTYASEMLSSGVDRELVANQIGDDVQTMSKYYVKYIPQPDHEDLIRNALNRIS